MNFLELWSEIITSLKTNRLRSALTVLGILIGVSSVVALVSIGEGAKRSILEQIKSIGTNLLVVVPSVGQPIASNSVLLNQKDVEVISGYDNVTTVAPESSQVFVLSRGREATPSLVVGTLPGYQEVRKTNVFEGRFFSEQEERNAARVAVIAKGTAEKIFNDEGNVLNESVMINRINFRIIGVLSQSNSQGSQDLVIIPLASMKRFLAGGRYFTAINLTAKEDAEVGELKERIVNYFSETRRIDDGGVDIVTQDDLISATSQATRILTFLLGAIASISLLVGGVGIMNMMFTSVVERTKEIGLRRAIGATKRDIKKQFLAESVVVCSIGAVLGIPLGWLAAYIFARLTEIAFGISVGALVSALVIAFVVGLLFGYLPARKASKVTPVEALRYD